MSWGAAFAGGVAAAGITLILLVLGAGSGFSSISPWAGDSMSATGLAVAAGIWLVIVQWLSSIVGGDVAGRLRTKWADHHSDEVFFRDTAHGFLAWGVATILMVGFTVYAGAGGRQRSRPRQWVAQLRPRPKARRRLTRSTSCSAPIPARPLP